MTETDARARGGSSGSPAASPASSPAEAAEQRLSEFYVRFVDAAQPSWRYALRHPRATVAAAADTRRLPLHEAEFAPGSVGRAIHVTLTRPGPFHISVGATGVAVLDVPADPAEYSEGSSKQTLRRKARKAERSGVQCRPVDDPAERRALLDLADAAEMAHADEQYRVERPNNDDLLDHGLWLAAFAADGTPLMLSVTPTDGEWGHLRYFRTLGSGPQHSDSRYLMTQVLVATLSERGVRKLVDGVHPADLPNGLRHFQRMVGFRLARVRARLTDLAEDGGATPGAEAEMAVVRRPLVLP
jgi:hypothetical protein